MEYEEASSQRLRKHLRPLLLTPQSLIKEHARVAQERRSLLRQPQRVISYSNQFILDHRLEKCFRVLALRRKQIDFEPRHKLQYLFTQLLIFFIQNVPAQRGNLLVANATLVNRKGLFVLMKTRWCFGNRADAEAQQNCGAPLGVSLAVAVEGVCALRLSHSIIRQGNVLHPALDLTPK